MAIIDGLLSQPWPVLNHWGYWVILVSAGLETLPGFGFLLPGQLIVMAGGWFAELGILDLGDVIWVAALGAIIGDLAGYWLGKKYGYALIARYGKFIFFDAKRFAKIKELVRCHPGKTLIIGRFNSFTRAIAPFISGASRIPLSRFLVYNIIGGVSWAAAFTGLGYIFGSSYDVAAKYIGKFMVGGMIVSAFIIYGYRFINKRKQIFLRYHLRALILNIGSLYLFSKMLEDVLGGELVTRLDGWFSYKIVGLWNPVLNKTMVFITNIAGPIGMLVLALILLAVLVHKKKWYCSALLIFGLAGGALWQFLIKLAVGRARPDNALVAASGYSFPSGHATVAIIFFSLLIYAFKDEITDRRVNFFFVFANILLILAVGFSRIYLNVHWFSDVVAGYGLGLFWLTLLILIFKVTIALAAKTLNGIKNSLEKIFFC